MLKKLGQLFFQGGKTAQFYETALYHSGTCCGGLHHVIYRRQRKLRRR